MVDATVAMGGSAHYDRFWQILRNRVTITKQTFEANEKPLGRSFLDELIRFSGYSVDLILQYVPKQKGHFLVFVRYRQNQIIRQVYTQRNLPKKFKDLRRAIEP